MMTQLIFNGAMGFMRIFLMCLQAGHNSPSFCSFDVRGKGLGIGRHWNDGVNLGPRARFEESSKPLPLLWIEDLREADGGTYRYFLSL